MISDDMSDDKIKCEVGKTIAIIEVNGFLSTKKINSDWLDEKGRRDPYQAFVNARRAARALKDYKPKNKKFAELADKLNAATEILDKSFALDEAAKNCQSAAEQKEINLNLKKLEPALNECLARSRVLAKEIEQEDEKQSPGR